jgi:hypothetical protein
MWNLTETERTVSRAIPIIIIVTLILLIAMSMGVNVEAFHAVFGG